MDCGPRARGPAQGAAPDGVDVGLRGEAAADGPWAVDLAGSRHGALIRTDLRMPGSDGLTPSRRVRQRPGPSPPDIAMVAKAFGVTMRMPPSTVEPHMSYAPEFLDLVDKFIHLANELAEDGRAGEVSAAILFAAGRYNAFNFLSNGGTDEARPQAVDFYVSEYRNALVSNLDGVVGPVVRPQG